MYSPQHAPRWLVSVKTRKTVLGVFVALVILRVIFTLQQNWKLTASRRVTSLPEDSHEDELFAFRKFAEKLSEVNIKLFLIEPFILFRTLPDPKREMLLKTGFKHVGMIRNVISAAITGRQDIRLNLPSVNFRLESSGFALIDKETANPMTFSDYLSKNLNGSPLITHFLYLYQDVIIHVVVFYMKGYYAWHGKWDYVQRDLLQHVSRETKLHFTESDGVYDRFTTASYPVEGDLKGLHMPRDPEHFLMQIPTSRMLSCLSKRNWNNAITAGSLTSGDTVPKAIFVKTAASLIKEVKSIMRPLMKPFWLASGTLLGWYRDCDVIPYTSDVDFATWGKDAILEEIFKANQSIAFLAALGQPDQDLQFWLMYKWLKVDLFFIYRKDDNFWAGGHNPRHGYSFRYLFPRFSLCSGVFLGFKVNIPCEVESILQAEYGPGWNVSVVKWDHEMSARNVLGRRYWDSEEKRYFREGKLLYQHG